MTLPHVLKRIRLHLARSKEFPSGSARHGYEFVASLDAKGDLGATGRMRRDGPAVARARKRLS